MRRYGTGSGSNAIIHFPGSCFTPVNNHEEWDKEYLKKLQINDTDVYCVNYLPTDTKDINKIVDIIDDVYLTVLLRKNLQMYEDVTISCTSSGCFFVMAWLITVKCPIHCVMNAPVLDPRDRIGKIDKKKERKQMDFFESRKNMDDVMNVLTNDLDNDDIVLNITMLVGTKDDDCVFLPSWLEDRIYNRKHHKDKINVFELDGYNHRAMCTKLSKLEYSTFDELLSNAAVREIDLHKE